MEVTQVDLLRHLVTCQLVERVQRGSWLRPEPQTLAIRDWLALHRVDYPWLDRIRIAMTARDLAAQIHAVATTHDGPASGDGLTLDDDSPQFEALRVRCERYLLRLQRHAML